MLFTINFLNSFHDLTKKHLHIIVFTFFSLMRRPIEQQYRIKIDGLPYHMTPTELVAELKKQPLDLVKFIETPEMPQGATIRYFYLVRQAAEKLARKRIFEWHDYPIRESYLVKCQLEYDRPPKPQHSSSSSSPSSTTVLQTDNQRLKNIFARKYSFLPSFNSFKSFVIVFSTITWC